MKFFRYFALPLVRPGKTLDELIADRRGPLYGLAVLALLGALYTFTVYLGYLRGFGAVTPVLLNVAPEKYYYYETFFCLPVFVFAAILFAGTARLIASALKGSGSFEQIFSVMSVCLTLPMLLTMWIPETALIAFFPEGRATPLGGFAAMPAWLDAARQIAGIVWPLAVMAAGIHRIEKLSAAASIAVTLAAFVPVAVLIAVFIR